MSDNYREFATTAAAVAREAGALLMDKLGRVGIEYKGEADLVTAADRASEVLITGRLNKLFPEHAVVAEEGARTEGRGQYRWFVDPLDGTTNFAHGIPFFAVSLGLERNGEIVAGAVYNPPLDEMFTAARGAGAERNGAPIAVSPQTDMAQALLATGFPSHQRHRNPNILFYQHFSLRTHGMRRLGAAALDLCYTACGRFEGYWEFNLKPWDTAAGWLVVTEAGGRVSTVDGGGYQLTSPEIVASNGHLHGDILSAFADVIAGRDAALPSARAYFAERESESAAETAPSAR